MGIVPAFDERKNSQACFCLGVEGMAVKQFALESGEETFTEGIVETISDRAHRRTDPSFPTALAKCQGSVLAAVIRVMDDALRVTLLDRHVEGIHHQGCLQMGGHCPTHDFAAPGIHDNGQIQPTCPSSDVSNIRDPQTVGSAGVEIALDEIGGRTCPWLSPGSVWGFAAANTPQTFGSHQASHPLATYMKPVVVGQFSVNARRAIGTLRFLVDFMNPFTQPLIRLRSFRRLSLAPDVIAAGRYL